MRDRSPAAAPAPWAGPQAMSAAPGERLPQPPRERKPALAALAVLLILGGALGSATLVLRTGKTTSVIVLARDVPAGAKLSTADFRQAEVSNADSGVTTVAWDQRNAVARYYAATHLVKGSLLVPEMTASHGAAGAGSLTIGLALSAAEMPQGLNQGDRIRLYTTDSTVPVNQRILTTAVVSQVTSSTNNSTSDATILTVIVDESVVPTLLAQAKAGTVAAALLPAGAATAAPPTQPAATTSTAPSTPAGQVTSSPAAPPGGKG